MDELPQETPLTVEQAQEEYLKGLNKPPVRNAANEKAISLTEQKVKALNVNSPEAAQVMGELQAQLAELRGEIADLKQAGPTGSGDVVDSGNSGYPWMYYKRADTGVQANWIVTGGGGATASGKRNSGAFVRYMGKGMKPITGYGVCDPPSAYRWPGGQYVPMLERGGAREFPAAQVVAYKWHVSPPIKGLKFPQFEAVKDTVHQFLCEDCDFSIWMLDEDGETGMACFRHLRADTGDGRHSYSRREATAILMEQKIPFSSGRYAAIAEELRRMDITGNAEALVETAKQIDYNWDKEE